MPELASARIPLVILHTDMPISEIRDFAKSYPAATFILESGPRKILYFISQVAELLTSCPNVFLSTYNFSNWMGIEQFCQKGFASRLLYGSHWPKYDTGVAMGPIITANIPWEAKCDIAGNNMRRLLGQQAMTTKETPFIPASPFIIDSHCHNIDAGVQSPCNFPLPDEHMSPADWIDFMNRLSIDKIFSTPTLPLYGLDSASHASQKMRKYAPSRFYYYEVFNP
ncbi:MAG TPA: hypothetical protein PKK48_10215, partial [Phycisphaerae bacterium]|nr:hypothetical protein [Phycisphaerae bacterium]